MKKLIIAIACVAAFTAYGQEDEATTEEFQLDFTPKPPLEIIWVFPSEADSQIDYKDILLRVGMKSASEVTKMSLLLNGIPYSTEVRGQGFIKKSHPDFDVYVEQNITLHEGGNVLKFAAENANDQTDVKERTILMVPKVEVFPVEVSWLYPLPADTLVGEKNVVVRVGVKSGSEIKKMSLLLNGLPVSTEVRGETLVRKSHPDYDVYVEQPVTLNEGGNILKFVAQNASGQSGVLERTIQMIPQAELAIVNRKDYALFFAIDEYDEWNDLTNPVNDARTIAKELDESYGFNVELIENFNRDEVLIKIREYARKEFGEYDQLFIFFAGHGQFDDLLAQGYIVAKDSKVRDEAKGSYISHSVLRNAIDNIPNKHILLAMDVCFGGTFDPVIARAGERGQGDLYSEIGLNEYISRRLRFKTRKYITSGGKQYVPDGRPGMHSPFASKILEGLRSYGGRDNIITLSELTGWIERINPEPRAGSFGTNEPGSDFVFVSSINK